ncbi:MAG: hypothetical protein HY280_03250 [Nitrospinae bacterium]|nr:hypothetical protein [Nitrospinota bacterium]
MSNALVSPYTVDCGWFALRVRHQNEFSVSEFFKNHFGLKVSVPARDVWKRRNGQKVAVIKPLLSNYVFVEADIEAVETKMLFSHKGVLGFVRQDGSPAVIPNDQVLRLEKMACSPAPVYELPYTPMVAGERVHVVAGPLAGAYGQFVRISPKTGRFIVSLDLFKRALVTELESDLLEPY